MDFPADAALDPGEQLLWQSQPGAGRLFLSMATRLVRDIVFLTVVGFALYAGWADAALVNRILFPALALFLVWLLISNLREAMGASVSHYLITDRRIILLTPRAMLKRFVILLRSPQGIDARHSTYWLDGMPTHGRITNGRATIRIRYQGYMQKSRNYPDKAYRSRTIRMYAAADPGRAIELLAGRRQR